MVEDYVEQHNSSMAHGFATHRKRKLDALVMAASPAGPALLASSKTTRKP